MPNNEPEKFINLQKRMQDQVERTSRDMKLFSQNLEAIANGATLWDELRNEEARKHADSKDSQPGT